MFARLLCILHHTVGAMDDLFSPGFLAGLDRELNAGLANGPGDAHLPRAAWDAGGLPGFDQPEPVDGTADPLFAEDGSVVVFTQDDWDANTFAACLAFGQSSWTTTKKRTFG